MTTHRPLIYRFTAWTGHSFWRNWLPERWQARWVARWLLRADWKQADPTQIGLYIYMPLLVYRVVDIDGHVEPVDGDPQIRLVRP